MLQISQMFAYFYYIIIDTFHNFILLKGVGSYVNAVALLFSALKLSKRLLEEETLENRRYSNFWKIGDIIVPIIFLVLCRIVK